MADPILIWNYVALEANRRDHTGAMAAVNQRGPTRSSRALAMVHIAIHDAYFGAAPPGAGGNPGNHPTYLGANLPNVPPGAAAHPDVSIANAAHDVLVELYPSQRDMFADRLQELMATLGPTPTPPQQGAITFGKDVARAIINLRRSDDMDERAGQASPAIVPFPPFDPAKGRHRVDPFNPEQGLLGRGYGAVKHFVLPTWEPLDSPPGWAPRNPPAGMPPAVQPFNPNDPAYRRSLQEVRRLGRRAGSNRTPDQTAVALYWAYDGAMNLGTPPRLYNQILRKIVTARSEPVHRNARLFALVNAAMADAAIDAWYYKYFYNLWRPVVGIREDDPSLGPETSAGRPINADADPFWEPLGSPRTNEVGARAFTPQFPAYPSGHATFGAAAFEVVRLFYKVPPERRDEITVDFVSDELDGMNRDSDGSVRTRHERRFPSLLDVIFENGVSRVYLGVHWDFDATTADEAKQLLNLKNNVGGIPLGRRIAQEIFRQGFHPHQLKSPAKP